MAANSIYISYILLSLLVAFSLSIVFRHALQNKQLFFIACFRRIIGFGSVSLTSAPQTVLLDRRSTSAGQCHSVTQQFSLRSLVEQITIPVRLNPFLFNGHGQTISVAMG